MLYFPGSTEDVSSRVLDRLQPSDWVQTFNTLNSTKDVHNVQHVLVCSSTLLISDTCWTLFGYSCCFCNKLLFCIMPTRHCCSGTLYIPPFHCNYGFVIISWGGSGGEGIDVATSGPFSSRTHVDQGTERWPERGFRLLEKTKICRHIRLKSSSLFRGFLHFFYRGANTFVETFSSDIIYKFLVPF